MFFSQGTVASLENICKLVPDTKLHFGRILDHAKEITNGYDPIHTCVYPSIVIIDAVAMLFLGSLGMDTFYSHIN